MSVLLRLRWRVAQEGVVTKEHADSRPVEGDLHSFCRDGCSHDESSRRDA